MGSPIATKVIPAASPGFWHQLRSFPRAFWMANAMEGIERWAYYGVRAVVGLYIVDAVAHGGLNFNHIQEGVIFAWWAIVQSLIPMFTGGYADRYGYKKTIAVSILIKMAGYLLMGTQHSFGGFLLGCLVLAAGTAVFKPGVQGIIANSTSRGNASMGWGLFYMLVNIGGFIGPWGAGLLRILAWKYVFFANAAIVALNFGMLLTFEEPASGHVAEEAPSPVAEFVAVLVRSVKDILFNPRLLAFILVNSGFWLMFNQLFDLMPNFIDDWVDTSGVLGALGHFFHVQAWITGSLVGQQIPPEWMINIDAGAIVLLMVPIAFLVRRWVTMTTMITGVALACAGMLIAGQTMAGSLCALGIFVFAVGEMLASPMLQKYMAEVAPAGQLGLYMGYSQVPVAIGWFLGDRLGGNMYQAIGDKVTLARTYMVRQLHENAAQVAAIPREKVVPMLATQLHTSQHGVTAMLFAMHQPERVWWVFAGFGALSLVGMTAYGQVVKRLDARMVMA